MQWTQVYDPIGYWWASTLIAALPIIVLLGLLAGFRLSRTGAPLQVLSPQSQ
jgi:lactate permease